MKRCGRCKKELPQESFGRSASGKDGLSYRCKPCDRLASSEYRKRNPDKAKKVAADYRQRNRDGVRLLSRNSRKKCYDPKRQAASYRKYTYGMSQEDFDKKAVEQNNRCAICQNVFTEIPNIDHNHSTGVIRDLLCRYCNWLLGNAYESIETLLSAAQYLKRHGDFKNEKVT
jgi:Recombination endonuclease VII